MCGGRGTRWPGSWREGRRRATGPVRVGVADAVPFGRGPARVKRSRGPETPAGGGRCRSASRSGRVRCDDCARAARQLRPPPRCGETSRSALRCQSPSAPVPVGGEQQPRRAGRNESRASVGAPVRPRLRKPFASSRLEPLACAPVTQTRRLPRGARRARATRRLWATPPRPVSPSRRGHRAPAATPEQQLPPRRPQRNTPVQQTQYAATSPLPADVPAGRARRARQPGRRRLQPKVQLGRSARTRERPRCSPVHCIISAATSSPTSRYSSRSARAAATRIAATKTKTITVCADKKNRHPASQDTRAVQAGADARDLEPAGPQGRKDSRAPRASPGRRGAALGARTRMGAVFAGQGISIQHFGLAPMS